MMRTTRPVLFLVPSLLSVFSAVDVIRPLLLLVSWPRLLRSLFCSRSPCQSAGYGRTCQGSSSRRGGQSVGAADDLADLLGDLGLPGLVGQRGCRPLIRSVGVVAGRLHGSLARRRLRGWPSRAARRRPASLDIAGKECRDRATCSVRGLELIEHVRSRRRCRSVPSESASSSGSIDAVGSTLDRSRPARPLGDCVTELTKLGEDHPQLVDAHLTLVGDRLAALRRRRPGRCPPRSPSPVAMRASATPLGVDEVSGLLREPGVRLGQLDVAVAEAVER